MQIKPTVIIATGIMNAGGTETLIMETLRHAVGRVHYIMLIHYENEITSGIFDDEIRTLGVEMRYIKSVGSLGVRGYVKAFKEFAKGLKYPIDIVHSHLNGSGGIISLAAKQAGIKHRICHCHADIHFAGSFKSRMMNEIQLVVMKAFIEIYATDRWACSGAAWRRLFMPWHKRTIINNMIDTKRYLSTPEKIKSAKKRFGFEGLKVIGAVGRVAPIKNYETILRAIQGTDVHFVCFGRFDRTNKYCKSLLTLAEKCQVSNQVHWMGNSKDVANDIHCFDLFVMPSFTEGFGMAAIEAQAAGIPTLLSTGVPAIVDVGLGLTTFLPPKDEHAWQKAILDSKEKPHISQSAIISQYKLRGFDSLTAVEDIENKYLSLVK